MRILITSDTHGQLSRFWEVFNKLMKDSPVQAIVHCGDYYKDAEEIRRRAGVPVFAVKGNCDGDFSDEGYMILETEAGDFLIVHGHRQDVGYDLQKLYYKTVEEGCVGAFFGHTHRSVYIDIDGIKLMNPGSLSRPRDGQGGTFGIIDTDDCNVWGKIYRYSDFIEYPGGSNNSEGSKGRKRKAKVTAGKLRELLNYSDRF